VFSINCDGKDGTSGINIAFPVMLGKIHHIFSVIVLPFNLLKSPEIFAVAVPLSN